MGHFVYFGQTQIKLWAKKCQPIFFKNTHFFRPRLIAAHEAWDTLAIHQKKIKQD